VGSGLTDPNARSMLGRWRQSFGDGAVLEVLAAAEAESPSDVVAWMNRSPGGTDMAGGEAASGWRHA
jgi:hypothetical protein